MRGPRGHRRYRRRRRPPQRRRARPCCCAPTWTRCQCGRRPGSPTPAPRPPTPRQRRAGDARLRPRRPRGLPAWRRSPARGGRASSGRARWSRCSSPPRRPATVRGRCSTTAWPPSSRAVDVAMAQHVLPLPAGLVGTRAGPTLSAADSMRITVHGRGAHGSMPQAAIDPVVLAAMIVVRLQTVVAREVAPGDTAVLTVGSIQAGTKSNVIPDRAVLQLNVRTYGERTRSAVLDAIRADRARGVPGLRLAARARVRAVRPLPAHRQRRRRHGRVAAAFDGLLRRPGRPSCHNRPPVRTSATSPPRSARRTPTGGSAASTPRPTAPPSRRAGWPRTSRSTTPPASHQSSNPPLTPEPRRSSSRPWPG